MIPPPVPAPAVLTAAQERDLARAIRAGRRARLLAQRHLAAHLPSCASCGLVWTATASGSRPI